MIERKQTIKKIQKILNEHYNHYVFGRGNEIFETDQEQDNFINIFTDIQNEFDQLYQEWGYRYNNSYEGEPTKYSED